MVPPVPPVPPSLPSAVLRPVLVRARVSFVITPLEVGETVKVELLISCGVEEARSTSTSVSLSELSDVAEDEAAPVVTAPPSPAFPPLPPFPPSAPPLLRSPIPFASTLPPSPPSPPVLPVATLLPVSALAPVKLVMVPELLTVTVIELLLISANANDV